MKLRVQLVGVSTPSNVLLTLSNDTLLNAAALKHMLPKDYLAKNLPKGTGVHFDFSRRNECITLRTEGTITVHLHSEEMKADEEYPINLKDHGKLLHIGDMILRADIRQSHF